MMIILKDSLGLAYAACSKSSNISTPATRARTGGAKNLQTTFLEICKEN